MSRTSKGGRKSGTDNYPTPRWAVDRFLEVWPDLHEVGNRWIEPAAGDGVIIERVNRAREGIEWTAVDIRDTRPALRRQGVEAIVGDFLHLPEFEPREGPKPFDVAILNPPFRLTLEFVVRCLALATTTVVMQRLNYVGSEKRWGFFQGNIPDLYVIPNRVSFSGDGNSDSVENAWHVWGPHEPEDAGLFRLLGLTPLEERRKDRRRIVKARDERAVTLDALFASANSHEWHGPEDGDLWMAGEA